MILKKEIETPPTSSTSQYTPQTVSTVGLVPVSGKVLTVSKTMELTSPDDTSVATLPSGTKTLLATDGSAAALTHIPVPVYADDSAAAIGGLAVGQCYAVTSTGVVMRRMA